MLTYEQLAPLMYKIAGEFAQASRGRFEPAELVNEVWLKGNVQRLKSIKFAPKRIRYDIIDYMRQQTSCRRKYKIYFHSPQTSPETDLTDIIFVIPDHTEEIDDNDFFEYLIKGLDRKCTLTVKLVAAGFSGYDISRVLGYSLSESHLLLNGKIRRHIQHRLDLYQSHERPR